MALVSVGLVSILSGDILLFLVFIFLLSAASVDMPDDVMMVMLTGHNFLLLLLLLVLMALPPVAGEVVPALS